jgi:hypothetical protein
METVSFFLFGLSRPSIDLTMINCNRVVQWVLQYYYAFDISGVPIGCVKYLIHKG